jgi:hypothetical protein
LTGPDNFTLRVPGSLSGVTLSAITDSDGDGDLNPSVDAHGSIGPFDLGASSIGSQNITLVTPTTPTTGLSGVINYGGTTSSGDLLIVGLYLNNDMSESPAYSQVLPASFPVNYEFMELGDVLDAAGVTTKGFYVNAVLDVGGDMDGEYDPNDVFGLYSSDGSTPREVTVEKNRITSGVNFTMGNWHPLN